MSRYSSLPAILLFTAALCPAGETLEEAEQQILRKQADVRSLRLRLLAIQELPLPLGEKSRLQVRVDEEVELLRKGDAWLSRREQRMQVLREETEVPKGQTPRAGGVSGVSIHISDGEFVYSYSDGGSEPPRADKRRRNPAERELLDRAFFDDLHREHDVTLAAAEEAEKLSRQYLVTKPVWVIQAVLREPKPGSTMKTLYFFDKSNGLMIKSVARDAAGADSRICTWMEVRLNEDIPRSRFVLEPPAGVKIVDHTQSASQPAETGKPQSGKAPDKP